MSEQLTPNTGADFSCQEVADRTNNMGLLETAIEGLYAAECHLESCRRALAAAQIARSNADKNLTKLAAPGNEPLNLVHFLGNTPLLVQIRDEPNLLGSDCHITTLEIVANIPVNEQSVINAVFDESPDFELPEVFK
jgi:hypothetical protein